MGFRAGPFVLCKGGCWCRRRRNTNFGPEIFFFTKNPPPPPHMCSQNVQRDVGIILSHICWGRPPPPPPHGTAGRAAPAQTSLPARRPRREEGGLGKWASVPPPPPHKAIFFPPCHSGCTRVPMRASAQGRLQVANTCNVCVFSSCGCAGPDMPGEGQPTRIQAVVLEQSLAPIPPAVSVRGMGPAQGMSGCTGCEGWGPAADKKIGRELEKERMRACESTPTEEDAGTKARPLNQTPRQRRDPSETQGAWNRRAPEPQAQWAGV